MAANQYQYVKEIQNMMFGYGDYIEPLRESAEMIEGIVLQQMQSLLVQASEFSKLRGKPNEIGHEDILFLLRRNRVKLRRLLKYMELKDLRSRIYTGDEKEEAFINALNPKLELGFKPKMWPNSKVYRCIAFLKSIDHTGELSEVLNDDLFDQEKQARLIRQDAISLELDKLSYIKYQEARRSSFATRNPTKFKSWIRRGSSVKSKLTKLALGMIAYLAQETVAKIVDLCLIAKEKRVKGILAQPYSKLLHKRNASELHNEDANAEFAFKPMTYKNISEELNVKCITPNDIWEVLYCFYQPKYQLHAAVTCNVVDERLFCC